MDIFSLYKIHREKNINGLWIHYNHIDSLIKKFSNSIFRKEIIGYSEKNIPIHKLKIGKGKIRLLFWTQMHGDESTSTKVLFDMFNYFQSSYTTDKDLQILFEKCTLVFIPMLNPDAALAYTRVNAHNKDLNRDALLLETAEGRVLHSLITSYQPHFAFNLHDQDSFYNVSGSSKPATFSFLAPAADEERNITKARKKAMSVIYTMYDVLRNYIPGQMARYNDSFCNNCFGDTIQKLGFPTILIESGYYPNDEHREITRKYHFVALLSAIFAISKTSLLDYNGYFDIPNSEKLFYDYRFDNVIYKGVKTSIGIRYNDFVIEGKLTKVILKEQTIIGDELIGKYFHKIVDANGEKFSKIKLD